MFDAATLAAITQEARQAFLEEDAPECLEQLTRGYQSLEAVLDQPSQSQARQKLLKDMGRAAHSLKGGAGMSALTPLQVLCHSVEDLFEALEQNRVQDRAMASGLIGLAIEEVQTLLSLANLGQLGEEDEPPELAKALSEFLATCQPQPSQAGAEPGDVSQFARTSLTVELEACLERVERRLARGGTETELRNSFNLLLEECTLLGQALSCGWLEQASQEFRQCLTESDLDLTQLMPQAIAEIRELRSQFLAGELIQAPAPEPPAVVPDPVIPQMPVERYPTIPPQDADLENLPRSTVVKVPVPAPATASATPRQTLRIPLDRLNRLSNTVSELLINQERLLEYDKQLRQASRNLKKRGQQLSPIREQVQSLYDELAVSDQTYVAMAANGQTNGDRRGLEIQDLQDFDALEMDSYSAVHGILQRFQELMVQVQEIQEDVDLVQRDLQETLLEMNQSLQQLDDELTQSRLVPFNTLARTFIQPMEKLGDRHQKPVKFVIDGDATLIEVAILDQLRTPLTHLLRNAFDHGLEKPADRQAAGKPRAGTITLSAAIAHNQVVVTVADDGRGVDLAKVKKKAIELGMSTPEALSQASDTQILDFLFQPGFSTASQVSDLSGRGLGLDIVKQMIEARRGTLSLETQWGQGSQFIIRIPLTLSITPLLLVRCQQRLMAFPSESIVRILSLDDYPMRNGHLTWQSQSLPVRPLMEILPYPHTQTTSPGLANRVGLMVQFGHQPVVLTVEKIVDERPLVVKALDGMTPIPPYVAGCTVLGTGDVVPVLIPNNFAVLWRSVTPTPATPKSVVSTSTAAPRQITILAIDDSITVRRTLQRVLTPAGFHLIQCRDGQEAWDLLTRQRQGVDLALCDIEMPNMDGFSLLQLIRAHEHWRTLPVVMLTSRDNPLHRNRAEALGASGYLTKPFQPNQLITSVHSFLANAAPMT